MRYHANTFILFLLLQEYLKLMHIQFLLKDSLCRYAHSDPLHLLNVCQTHLEQWEYMLHRHHLVLEVFKTGFGDLSEPIHVLVLEAGVVLHQLAIK